MCCGCYNVSIGNGVRVKSCGNKTCDMSHINHKVSANALCDLGDALEVDDPGISGRAGYDELRLTFVSRFFHSLIVDGFVFGGKTVGNEVEVFTGEIDGASVGQVTAVGK